nr:hypothetical protein L203_06616 [Cryptococcus depauperatus CBS 7841]
MFTSKLRLQRSKPITRILLLACFVLGPAALFNFGKDEDGIWDASCWSERRGSFHKTGKTSNGEWKLWKSSKSAITEDHHIPRLITTQQNVTTTQLNHPGKSRRIKPGSDPQNPQYIFGPLPTLDEAWEFLHPLLNEVKQNTPSVPREHELSHSIFPPFLTQDLKDRYQHLRDVWDKDIGDWVRGPERRWYLVTVCRQVAGMLGDWFAAWTVLADFLGPESLVFSLLENDSEDGSGEILAHAMRAHLLNIGVPPANINIKTHLPNVDWEQYHRIEVLAQMRNAGMQAFYDSGSTSPDGHPWTGIIFYNDVYLSATHFLELMHQHFKQDADMTCGWDHAGRWFYDGWVGRDMSGDLYTPFPVKEEDNDLPQKASVFPSSPETKRRYDRMLPFQVFSAWNGIAVMTPEPFLPPYNVRFRRGTPRTEEFWECQLSECSFISWDFWKYGFGRIAVIPGVHATYGKKDAMTRGWIEWPLEGDGLHEKIRWNDRPPERIRCHDWPDKLGKEHWAWDTVRWVKPPNLEIPPTPSDINSKIKWY